MVAGDDKVGLGLPSSLQDAIVGIVGNNRQALLRPHHLRENF